MTLNRRRITVNGSARCPFVDLCKNSIYNTVCKIDLQKDITMAKSERRIRIFSALEVANICGVVNQTAINWIRSGHLKAFTTPGGQYRVYAKDLTAFLDTRGMSASEEFLKTVIESADYSIFMLAADQSTCTVLTSELEALLPSQTIVYASNWFEVGRKCAEYKPGFLLIDTALQGVEISSFVHSVKSDHFFGKPYIFLLADADFTLQPMGSESQKNKQPDAIFTKPLDLGKLLPLVKSLEGQAETVSIA